MHEPTPQAMPDERDAVARTADAAAKFTFPDIVYQIYLAQMQQLGVLAVALAGGALVMHQVGLFKGRPWAGIIAAIVFALAALLSVIGTFELTRGATEGKDIRKSMKLISTVAMFLVGIGTGLVIVGLLRTAGIR